MSTTRTSDPLILGDHVRDLSWRSDSRSFAAALGNGEVVLLEQEPSQIRVAHRWRAHTMGTFRARIHPSQALLVTSGEDGFIRWWEIPSGKLIQERREKGWVEHLIWSPDGQLLLTAAGRRLLILTLNGKSHWEYSDHGSTVLAIAWRGDGKGVASACLGRIQLFRLGESIPYEDLNHSASFESLAWSSNGRQVAAGTQDKSIVYWKLPFRDTQPLNMHGYAHKAKSLAYDSSCRWLATSGSDKSVTVWDLSGKGPAGSKPTQFQGHTQRITQVAFQTDGPFLASGCAGGQVWMWTPSRGDGGVPCASLEGEITRLAWAPDNKTLALGSSGGQVQCVG